MTEDLQVVSLFAGIGGFDLAFEQAGAVPVVAVEIDPKCRALLRRHWPDLIILDDVRKVTGELLRSLGIDPVRCVVCFGWPCQDLSVAGRRAGLDGTRSGLFWEAVRIVGELQPRWFVAENVHGLLSAVCTCPGNHACVRAGRAVSCGEWRTKRVNGERVRTWHPHVLHSVPGGACPGGCFPNHGGAMGSVLGAMAERGYGFAYRVLDAQYTGVPQRRRRVFFVGNLGDWGAPSEVLLEPESVPGSVEARPATGQDIAGTVGARVGGSRTTDLDGQGAYVTPLLEVGARTGQSTDDPRAGIGIGDDGDPMFTLQAGKQHGIAVTAATLQGGGKRGHRVDAEAAAGGHLVVASTLTAGVAAGDDVNPPGRRAEDDRNLVVVDLVQVTHPENRASARPGQPAPTLNGDGQTAVVEIADTLRSHPRPGSNNAGAVVVQPVALRGRDEGNQVEIGEPGEPAFAVRGPGGGSSYSMVAVAEPVSVTGRVTHAITSDDGHAGEDGTGRGVPMVAVPVDGYNGTVGEPDGAMPTVSTKAVHNRSMIAHPLNASMGRLDGTVESLVMEDDGELAGVSGPVTAFSNHQRTHTGEIAEPVTASKGNPGAVATSTIRRLSPLECERLQGFPDYWTLTADDGSELSDAARYAKIGNAVAVPCVRWIADRVVAVHKREVSR